MLVAEFNLGSTLELSSVPELTLEVGFGSCVGFGFRFDAIKGVCICWDIVKLEAFLFKVSFRRLLALASFGVSNLVHSAAGLMLIVLALLVLLLLVVEILLGLLSLGSAGKVVGLTLAGMALGAAAVEATFVVSP